MSCSFRFSYTPPAPRHERVAHLDCYSAVLMFCTHHTPEDIGLLHGQLYTLGVIFGSQLVPAFSMDRLATIPISFDLHPNRLSIPTKPVVWYRQVGQTSLLLRSRYLHSDCSMRRRFTNALRSALGRKQVRKANGMHARSTKHSDECSSPPKQALPKEAMAPSQEYWRLL